MDSLKLSDVCRIVRGERITKTQLDPNGTYDVWSGGVTPMGKFGRYNREPNVTTVAQYGSAGYVEWHDKKFWANDVCYTLYPCDSVISKYLYYAVKNQEELLYRLRTDAVPACLPLEVLQSISVPVPPLPVQEEIVRILDKFTELEAELAQELAQELAHRKQQYAFYRDQLLNFDSKIPMVKLKDIATNLYRGSGIKRDQVTDDGVPCVRYGEIYTTYNIWFDKCVSHTQLSSVDSPKYFEHGDILFAITGENIEDIAKSIAYVGHDKCLAGGDIVVMKHNQNPKYLAYVLSTYDAIQQKGKGKVKSKVVHSSVPAIGEITIPLPSLDIQQRIVNVLDNFDTICSDLSIGLPAEISARQKQYEYYRDLLFEYAANGLNYNRAQQSTTEHNRAQQSTTEHNRAQQSTTEHNRAQQS